MSNHDLQFFNPIAVNGLSIGINDFDLRQFTLPHYFNETHKERLVALLLSALRARSGERLGEASGGVIRLSWENREWLNARQAPAIKFGHGDVLWLVVNAQVTERELLQLTDNCPCLVLIDLRVPHSSERGNWMATLKLALLDAVQKWWKDHVNQAEADQVDFLEAGEWFESPIDALDYCNAVATGLFTNHSLVYVERQAMADILAAKAAALPIKSVIALVAFALRDRWEQLRFSEPMAMPNPAKHFSEWRSAGLGWQAGAEFVPLNAIEKLAEREVLEHFFAHWNRELKVNERICDFWDRLRVAIAPQTAKISESQLSASDTSLRPSEAVVPAGGTSGDAESIRMKIARYFPDIAKDADDSVLQQASAKESDENRRLLLLAWRASLWLDKAGDRDVTAAERLRAENDVIRAIDDVWNRLNLKASPDQLPFVVAETWARLRTALADHVSERARVVEAKKLNVLADMHLTKALAVFHALGIGLEEANVLDSMGHLKMRLGDFEAARSNYEAALEIYGEEGADWGEANVLRSLGDLNLREDDLSGARNNFEDALEVFRETKIPLGEANVLVALGDLKQRIDDLAGATESYESALEIYRQEGSRQGQANVLTALGDLKLRMNDAGAARANYEEALAIYRQVEERLGEASVLFGLGELQLYIADLTGAQTSYESALAIYRQSEDSLGEASVLFRLGGLKQRVDDFTGARSCYDSALATYRRIKSRLGEANVLRMMGDLTLRENNVQKAELEITQALTLYRDIEDRMGEAEATASLGRVALARGDAAEAERLLQDATTILQFIKAQYEIAEQIGEFGWFLLRRGEKDAAKGYLLRAAEAFDAVSATDQARRHRQAVEQI